MTFFDMKGLIEADQNEKPKGQKYESDLIELKSFYEEHAQTEIRSFLQAAGLGDKNLPVALDPSLLKRIVEEQSVVYSTPPVRRLEVMGIELADDSDDMRDLDRVFSKMMWDVHWQVIDELRNLYRQVCVSFTESKPHGCVQLRIFEPFNLKRKVDPAARDIMDADEAVAFLLQEGKHKEDQIFELWTHEDDGTWRAFRVNGAGEQTGQQPYGEEGFSPYGEVAPFMMVYDELPRNRAYLPLNENRLGFAKNTAGILNDLVLLVKQEAHSTIAISTDDARGAPTTTGPGQLFLLPGDSTAQVLSTSPKIRESAEQLDRILRLWAVSESLPGDMFKEDRSVTTGTALKVKERGLARRRKRQVPMVRPNEARAYEKLAAVHNVYAASWGLPFLPEDAELIATPSSTWQPADPKELQEVYFKDIAVGAESLISYIQAKQQCTRSQAIEKFNRDQQDRLAYPVLQQQNPESLVDGGPHSATGPGGAQKVPGAFNPELETATEGASVTDAVRGAVESEEIARLNGAQVTAALQIVQMVAGGNMGREAGINQIQTFFGLSKSQAEGIMGPAGM